LSGAAHNVETIISRHLEQFPKIEYPISDSVIISDKTGSGCTAKRQ
jgi:hypothetical protein